MESDKLSKIDFPRTCTQRPNESVVNEFMVVDTKRDEQSGDKATTKTESMETRIVAARVELTDAELMEANKDCGTSTIIELQTVGSGEIVQKETFVVESATESDASKLLLAETANATNHFTNEELADNVILERSGPGKEFAHGSRNEAEIISEISDEDEENENSAESESRSINNDDAQEHGEETDNDSGSERFGSEEDDVGAGEEFDSNDELDEDNRGVYDGDDDDDIAVISDSSDEDAKSKNDGEGSQSSIREPGNFYGSDVGSDMTEDEENECDYSDLMDDVIVSKAIRNKNIDRFERKEEGRREEKLRIGKIWKRKRPCNWRAKLKKRSIKWLKSKIMRNINEAPSDVTMFDLLSTNVTIVSKISQSSCHTNLKFAISQVESLPSEKMTNVSKSSSYSSEAKVDESGDVLRKGDCLDDIRRLSSNDNNNCKDEADQQQQSFQILSNNDEHNKENIERVDKLEANVPKSHYATMSKFSPKENMSGNKTNEIVDIDESDDLIEISDEPSVEMTTVKGEDKAVIENKTRQNVNPAKEEENSKCDNGNPLVVFEMHTDFEPKPDLLSLQEENRKEELKKASQSKLVEQRVVTEKLEMKQKSDQILLSELPKNETSHLDSKSVASESTLRSELVKLSEQIASESTTLSPTPIPNEVTTKRLRSASPENIPHSTDTENIHPAKKLKAQLDSNFSSHDQILNEYINKTSNNSADEIERHLTQLIVEIQALNDMIKTKEIEWNNLLYLKKIKEEICFRLTRKKQAIDIMSTKVGQVDDGISAGAICDGEFNLFTSSVKNLNNPTTDDVNNKLHPSMLSTGSSATMASSTPLAKSSMANNSAQMINNFENTTANLLSNISTVGMAASHTQEQQHQNLSSNLANINNSIVNILQNRANMKSSELIKEKATTQRLHRILVSRNILPKPSTTTANGNTANGLGMIPKTSVATSIVSTSFTNSTMQLCSAVPMQLGNTVSMNLTNVRNEDPLLDQKPTLNNYLATNASLQKHLGELLNGHHNSQKNSTTNGCQLLGIGRQGAFKDVKSIIADYRQKHPEAVPRRGRRIKSVNSLTNMSSGDASTYLSNVLKAEGKGAADLGALLAKFDGNSRPSSNDSSHSANNPTVCNPTGNMSFKDILIQFAKMSEQNASNNPKGVSQDNAVAPSPFPEVTLHPVTASHSIEQASGSLLHGILTKYNPSKTATATTSTTPSNYNSSFSPTLARLLTAPERISATHNTHQNVSSYQSSNNGPTGLNISKMVTGHNSEITITPVVSSHQIPTLLQQQFEQHQMSSKRDRIKLEHLISLKDDEADDSIDRLVIDEGGDSSMGVEENLRIAPNAYGLEFNENEVPACQGCKKNEAQFVCAGCANQLYCSRDCQVAAWDEHSEVCTG